MDTTTARRTSARPRKVTSSGRAGARLVADHKLLPLVAPSCVTPILRWAGSKRKVLPILATFWTNEFKRYVEPFAGSAALYFKLQPEKALLGDINAELIDAYDVIRDRPDDVYKAVSSINHSEQEYYRVRAQNTSRLKSFGRAVRFVYLNRYCFNGIYRTNRDGRFNVPYAHTRPGAIPSIEHFRRCATLLRGATLKAGDFGAVLSVVRPNDFVYLDPPYAVESRRVFRQYDRREFGKRDLERLAAHLDNINRIGATFVVSYADCREARRIFSRWVVRRIRVRRNIAGFVSARRMATELLVTNK